MTTIAYRDGVLAADSLTHATTESAGEVLYPCEKLFRRTVGRGKQRREVLIGTAGEASPSSLFVEWYGSGKPRPKCFKKADFQILLVEPTGVFETDESCVLQRVVGPYHAIGSGRKAAFAAMACGKTALEAVAIAAMFDPYTGGEIVTMRLRP